MSYIVILMSVQRLCGSNALVFGRLRIIELATHSLVGRVGRVTHLTFQNRNRKFDFGVNRVLIDHNMLFKVTVTVPA